MGKIKKLKFDAKRKATSTLLWEQISTCMNRNIIQRWYRDADGYYWKTFQEGEDGTEGEGGMLNPESVIEEMVWFYCAYAPRGDMRGSNETVRWCSEEWDCNHIMRDIITPARVTELENNYWEMMR